VRQNHDPPLIRASCCDGDDMTKSPQNKTLEAELNASKYLADGNQAAEAGNQEKAEKLWAKGQFWLDRYNKLAGNK